VLILEEAMRATIIREMNQKEIEAVEEEAESRVEEEVQAVVVVVGLVVIDMSHQQFLPR
jgi:hypothetical protein